MSRERFIVLADDYDENAHLLAIQIAAETGCACDYATSGQEAMEVARRRRPDACVLDIEMPELDGIETARLLRAEVEDTRSSW